MRKTTAVGTPLYQDFMIRDARPKGRRTGANVVRANNRTTYRQIQAFSTATHFRSPSIGPHKQRRGSIGLGCSRF
jgi:hypothetical protein